MQVDPTLMNVGDGGTVSREISAPKKASTSMVGNPPQTLPPEFRGDVTLSQQNKTTPTTDCKTAKACLDTSNYNHSPELSPPQQPNNAPMSSSALTGSEKKADKGAETAKLKVDGVGVFPATQWSGGVKVSREGSLNPCHSSVTSSKKLHLQTQAVQSVPPGFQCSTMFKPPQPVAFLPSTNFSSPLCKITLPPALGQIAALREATASQFQKEIQPQSSGVGGTPLMRTYPYPFSMGRAPAGEKKPGTSTSKLKSNLSSSKNSKYVGEHKSLASVVASPAITLPLQHPSLTSAAPTHYTLSPTAAICCGPALASITSQSRLLNHVEKGNSIDKTTMGSLKTTSSSASEEHTACLIEPRDVPLDLSAKSKRPKCINDPPVSVMEPHNNESNQRDFLNSKRTHSTTYNSSVQYPILLNTHRNGSHQKHINKPQNHQVPEPKPTWGKGSSQDSIKNIPGTYVGVASPILASTLRGKDGKGTFADEFQSFAKQEFISIIDQGEHLASGGKKPSSLMKGNQHAYSVKHVKNTSTAIATNCPSKGAPTTALSSSASTQIHQKSAPGKTAVPYSTTVVSPVWQQPPHVPHQASSVQRKVTQGSPKTKGSRVTEGSKYMSAHHSPSKHEDDKWERLKSPLSNLASIVKQQTLETTALAAEGNTQASPVTSRKSDVLNPLAGSRDTQSKHSSAYEYPPYWSVEKWPGVLSQGDPTQAMKRLEKVYTAEPLENNTELHTSHNGSSPQRVERPVSLNSSATSSKDTDTIESSFPRLRRGRRRADEARLDLWGFATPSPPPPPMPPPPISPTPPMTPTQLARRPRGRPRSNPLPERVYQGKGKTVSSGGDTPAHKKRRRCRSKKYQSGEYITEKEKLEDQCPSPTAPSPEPPSRRPSFTRSGAVRYQESEVSSERNDKPSGKRKFKSKHLCDSDEQSKAKRSSLGKRGASLALDDDGAVTKRTGSPPPTPKCLPSPPSSKKGSPGRSSKAESRHKRPVPPEVRRLIVNKNAGETLLQRAARLGYQDVVQYCLEKDIREVNRRDNAGYTALHEASSRGWTQIVQMLLKHGADVNCSAQDGTPLHDAVASDNLPVVWLLLNHGADPTLATYSGHTPVKLAHSPSMKTFLTYFTDLEGRSELDPCLAWEFYSSSLFTDQEPCWDFLLSEQNQELEENVMGMTERDSDKDCLLFEFSDEPLLPCYHVQVSLTQFCNWFLLTDVLKRLKMSARIFRARYPHMEVVSVSRAELWRQVSVSQVSAALASPYRGKIKEEEEEEKEEDEEGLVDLVHCVPELQRLLGSSIHILQEDEEEEEEKEETLTKTGKPCGR
uniref:BCL-6 corepressor PCGF1 binding domain-containing protein n=1 Tax=Monopterus albus TaxID=43700 RepID=A0A3Q3JF08_MONAL